MRTNRTACEPRSDGCACRFVRTTGLSVVPAGLFAALGAVEHDFRRTLFDPDGRPFVARRALATEVRRSRLPRCPECEDDETVGTPVPALLPLSGSESDALSRLDDDGTVFGVERGRSREHDEQFLLFVVSVVAVADALSRRALEVVQRHVLGFEGVGESTEHAGFGLIVGAC